MARQRPTIYDVAARAGVSKSLVSLVLRRASGVSAARRDAVLAAIEELGYRPSRAAATLASRSRSVGVLVDDYRNLWFVDLLDGLRAPLRDAGLHVAVADEHEGPGGEDALDGFIAAQVEGLVVAAEIAPARLAGLPVPVVVAGSRDADVPGVDVVTTDDSTGIALALTHLTDLGHTRIGYVAGAGTSADRRTAAVRTFRLAPVVVAGLGLATDEEGGYQGTRELLGAAPRLTAVLAANDTMALGCRAALREAGLAVPGDVSLVGYDNSPLAGSHDLDLTTVDDRSIEVGRIAAEALLARLADPCLPGLRSVVEPRLVVRSSTGQARPRG